MGEATLTFLNGELKGQGYLIPEEVSIGRSDANTIMIDDNALSSRHCMVYLKGDRWFVKDMDSTNGTMVNSRPVHLAELYDDDVILVGGTQLAIHVVPEGKDVAHLKATRTLPHVKGTAKDLRQTMKISPSDMPGFEKKKKQSVKPTDRWRRRFVR